MDINAHVSQVLASTDQSNQRMAGIADMLGTAAQNEYNVATQGIAGARQDIPAAQALAGQEADITYQRSALVQQLQQQANLDPTVADNAYAAGLADLTAINSQRKATAAQVTALQSKNLFDDPFAYIVAQLNLPVVQGKLEGLDKQAAVVTQDVNDRLSLAASAKSTVVANTADAVKKIQLQGAELKAREAQRALDTASAATQSKLAADYLKQISVLDKINDNTRQSLQMQISVAQWEATMAERAEARKERAEARAQRRQEIKDKTEAEMSFLADLNATRMALGQRPLDRESFLKMPKNTPQMRAQIEVANAGTFGAGLSESWRNITTAGINLNAVSAGGNEGFARFVTNTDAALESYVSEARRTVGADGKFPSEKEAVAEGMRKLEAELVAGMSDPKGVKPLNSPHWDSVFTPYKSQYKVMTSIADNTPGLKGNVVVEVAKTMLPTIPGNVSNFRAEDEQTLFNTLGTMVAKKQISANDAAKQISTYYTLSAAKNSDMFKYGLVGLKEQNSYMVKVRVPGIVSDTITPALNVMDETQAKKLVLSIAKAQEPFSTPIGPGVVPPFLVGAQQAGQTIGSWLTK